MSKTTMAATATLITLTGAISAQDWPTRPVTMVIPFAAGGGIDGSGRIQAQRMGEMLGQTIVVENVGGAAGTVGSARVAKSTPDGYSFVMGNTGTHAYSQGMRKIPSYNSVTDFAPVGLVTESPRILLARKDLPVNNLQEFVKYVKANQAKMQFGSAGVGSGTHLPCELLNSVLGVKVTHVPFKGAGPVMQELMAGRIDYFCDTIQTGATQAKAGTVKGLAVMSPKRVPIIPELATTGEQGLQGVEATVWNGFFFPKGTPDPIIRRMNKVMNAMIEEPAIRKRLQDLGLEILPPEQRTPEYLAKYLPQEVARWKKVIIGAGIQVE
ncbi:MAG: tripartite tricarboxylate transporter substrate binding protein BugD [Rhizobiales bacterium]|nr:tripartite tricarboxylate transporter substrate binding protein BugD [Hyphomicrobiales bacterium]